MLQTIETWLSDDARSSVSGAGRDFATGNMRVGWSSVMTFHLREETGVRSALGRVGTGKWNGNENVTHPVIRVIEMPAVHAYSASVYGANRGHGGRTT